MAEWTADGCDYAPACVAHAARRSSNRWTSGESDEGVGPEAAAHAARACQVPDHGVGGPGVTVAADRVPMSRSVDLVLDELPARGDWAEVMTVGLAGTEGLALGIGSQTWRAFPCRDMLAVATIASG